MSVNQNQLSGKIGYVNLGSTSYAFRHWSAPIDAEMLDVSNFLSGGFDQIIVGFLGGKIDLEGAYDQGNMPLVVGNLYTFHLGFVQLGSVELVVPAIIKNVTPTVDAKKEQIMKVEAKSTGIFTVTIS